ncbi:MAG: hypothetical protein ACR2JG_12340 [Geodermatophilaceae bacterium]
MTANGVPEGQPEIVRRLDSVSASTLVDLVEAFEDLQMVLRCCERLVAELAVEGSEPDGVLVEAVWTMALLSYARCFSAGGTVVRLTEEDVKATQPDSDVLEWHQVLKRLRDHYTDPATNPRERFSVGVAQDASGAASGVAITSARQPLVDDLTVRQTGAIAYALSGLVNGRIEAQQAIVFEELKDTPEADLEKLAPLDLARPVTEP